MSISLFENPDLIALCYGACSVIRIVAHLPEIFALTQKARLARSILLSFCLGWIGANAVSMLLSSLGADVLSLTTMSLLNGACGAGMLIIITVRRLSFGRDKVSAGASSFDDGHGQWSRPVVLRVWQGTFRSRSMPSKAKSSDQRPHLNHETI